jgi:SOS-response transcriptional repressor LexA
MYRYIVRFKRQTAGDSPTRREIQAALDLPSVSMVQHHLESLEAAGRIRRPSRGKARRIVVPGARWEFEEVGGGEGRNKCALCGEGEAAELP